MRERAARVANAAWAVHRGRLPYRTHAERIRALIESGQLNGEAAFEREPRR